MLWTSSSNHKGTTAICPRAAVKLISIKFSKSLNTQTEWDRLVRTNMFSGGVGSNEEKTLPVHAELDQFVHVL